MKSPSEPPTSAGEFADREPLPLAIDPEVWDFWHRMYAGLIFAAGLPQGMRPRQAITAAERLLSAVITGGERSRKENEDLSRSQLQVRQVRDLFLHFGATPPAGGVCALWIRLAGGLEPLLALLQDLGARGALSRGPGYVFGALRRLPGLQESPKPPPGPPTKSAYPHGHTLPTGWRWSQRTGDFLPPDQWQAEQGQAHQWPPPPGEPPRRGSGPG